MADKNLFNRLKRLFSTNVVIRNVGGDQLKVTDTERIQSFSDLNTNFLKSRGMAGFHSTVGRYGYNELATISMQRLVLFRDYDLMETDPIIASALDVYADESTVRNEFGDLLTIRTDDDRIKDVLHNLFYDVLNIEFNIWPWVRTLCKYGDHFLKLEISEKYGIVNVIPASPYEITREEGFDPENPFRVKFKHEGLMAGQLEYENYEIAHFRLLGDTNFLPYGKCLAPETYVDTECGSKMIKDITTEDKVWTFNSDVMIFELSNILHKIDSGEKNIIRISTQHNFIDCSENHPILVFDDNTHKLEYKKAIDIKLKDLLVVSNDKIKKSKEYYINKNLSDDFNKNGWKNDINLIPTIVDVEFAELFGFLIGDGWINADVNSVHFAMGMDEELNNKYISLLEKYSGKKICKSKIKLNSNSRSCWVNSKMLAQILKNNGFNGTAHTKRIPYWIFESDENIRKAFIIGLTNADGSMSTDEWCNRYVISLCNKELILDFKKLIQTLNIKTSIPVHKYYNEKIEICGVECNSTEAHYFYYYLDADEKNQIKKYNKLNLDETSKFILEPVKKIEDFGLSKTYDIQVDNKNSNFIANGIVVHNSMIESGRRVWKQLQLMEDAMLIHRIMRAPEKRIFKIDTGNIPPNETEQYIKSVVNKIKKTPYVDPRTGEYNLKYNMMNMTEDFFIPVRGGDSGTNIESLPGLEYNAIDDIEYLRNKMMAALKIPKAFLGYEEGISGKATLAAEDVRFARTIERIQKIFISELTKIAVIHLYAQGFKDDDIVNFELSLTNPSTIYEQEKIALWQEKISLVRDMQEIKLLSNDWIYNNIINLAEDEIQSEKKKVLDDVKTMFRHSQIENEGNDPFLTNQTFGTSHDLALLQKGINSPDEKALDFGKTNFKFNWEDSLGKDEKITDNKDYDKEYNNEKREPSDSKYGQDSHIRGRDPLGKDINTPNKDARKMKQSYLTNSVDMSNKMKTVKLIKESLKLKMQDDSDQKLSDEKEEKNYLDEENLLDL